MGSLPGVSENEHWGSLLKLPWEWVGGAYEGEGEGEGTMILRAIAKKLEEGSTWRERTSHISFVPLFPRGGAFILWGGSDPPPPLLLHTSDSSAAGGT